MNIDEKLLDLGFDITKHRGFEYWKEAFLYCEQNKVFKMEELYNHIATKYNSTKTAVEIAMRRCAFDARKNVIKKYKEKKEMTNKTMLNLLRIKFKQI